MRAPITLILSFVFIINTEAQKRIEKEFPSYTLIEESASLESAYYWRYVDILKEWAKNENTRYAGSRDSDTFSSIRFLKVKNTDNQEYYVFVYNFIDTSKRSLDTKIKTKEWHDYAHLEQGYYFVLTPAEYKSMVIHLQTKPDKPLTMKMKVWNRGYKNGVILKSLAKTIHVGRSFKYDKYFMLTSTVVDGEKLVRFRLPEEIKRTNSFFKKNYFEVPAARFNTILLP